LLSELVREQIGVMVNDVIEATQARIVSAGIETVANVRDAGHMTGGFSRDLAEQERVLKRFMYDNLYHHPSQLAAASDAKTIISDLYEAYSGDAAQLPPEWQLGLMTGEPERSRHIADFLAGMTDRYAQNCHKQIFGAGVG
jgi:dGTPase